MNKKASTYDQLGGRKLGRHLPRIASGDGDENWEEADKESFRDVRPASSLRDPCHNNPSLSPILQDSVGHGANSGEDVTGIPGRLRLSRDKLPSAPASPLPPSRLSRGLWADTQRHLLQAYEYLCHVGEAQQWIEGCLDEELEFGVVEMEERLRNGVVLAKLSRVFQGGHIVRRIYEVLYMLGSRFRTHSSKASKLDFRHSDNINYFFAFVREVGLPEVRRFILVLCTLNTIFVVLHL